MSLQRQHFLLSYLKTLSVGPAGVRTHDLPHRSPVLNQLSQPVGGVNQTFWGHFLIVLIGKTKSSNPLLLLLNNAPFFAYWLFDPNLCVRKENELPVVHDYQLLQKSFVNDCSIPKLSTPLSYVNHLM